MEISFCWSKKERRKVCLQARAESRDFECWDHDGKSQRVGRHNADEEGGYFVCSGDQVEREQG